MMWKQKGTVLTAAAIVAGLSYPTALAQDYYGDSGYYDQYGGGQYGAPSYDGVYGGSGYYDQYGSAGYGAGQYDGEISFDYFYDTLAPYGQWFRHPRWGHVWRPGHVGRDFRPYYQNGYWQNTLEFGWTWVSDYAWGDIAFHYGRWVHDPYDGWIWVPGYVWAPSWVVWRSGGGYLGWFPMPPTSSFLLGIELYTNDWRHWNRGFGYADWYGPSYGSSWLSLQWVFVDARRFGRRDFRRWVAPRNRVQYIVDNSVNITNYVTVNNYIVNRSLRGRGFDRVAGGGYDARPAREVLRRDSRPTGVDAGRRIQQRERSLHGGDPNASARERLAALPRGERHRDARSADGARNVPRINEGSTPERGAQQPRARNEDARPQRPAREQAVQQPRARTENLRPPRPAREQATRQPRVRTENVRPQRPAREQATRQPRVRTENVRPQRPQVAQRAQRAPAAAVQRQNPPRVVRNPPRQRATQPTRSRGETARVERQRRGPRNR